MSERPANAEPILVYRSRQFLFRLGTPGGLFDVLRVIFMKDGSYSVGFSAFRRTNGIVARCTLRAGAAPQSVSLLESGRVTSHLVKFTHHESGVAQFSLTGRVRTDVRRRAVPLAQLDGHAWTAMFRDPDALRRSERPATSTVSTKEQILTFNFERPSGDAFKFVAWQHPGETLRQQFTGLPSRAGFVVRGLDGRLRPMFLVAPPSGWVGGERAMIVSAEELNCEAGSASMFLAFIGGFDEPRIHRDERVATEFLALSYPADDFETVARSLGSIDLETKAPLSRT